MFILTIAFANGLVALGLMLLLRAGLVSFGRNEGMSVMLTESDLQHSERLVDRVIAIDRGAITL